MVYPTSNPLGGGGGFGARLTRTGWVLVIVYGAVYGVALFLQAWMDVPVFDQFSLKALGDPSQNLLHQPWRLVTHHFLHPHVSPMITAAGLVIVLLIAALVDVMGGRFGRGKQGLFFVLAMLGILLLLTFSPALSQALVGYPTTLLMLYFFSGSVERYFGTRRFIIAWVLMALGGVVVGQLFSLVYGLDEPFVGPMPCTMALIVLFGLTHRDAQIMLMLMLPVRGIWVAAITALVAVLSLLAKWNPGAAYWCGGIAVAFVFYKGWLDLLDFKVLRLRLKERQIKRKLDRFTVIEGGRGKDDVDDGPTYH